MAGIHIFNTSFAVVEHDIFGFLLLCKKSVINCFEACIGDLTVWITIRSRLSS